MGIFKFLFSEQLNSGLSVTILVMHFNQVFCSIWQYFSQEVNFFSRLSSLCFLNSDLHLACVCVGIMLKETARWEAFFSQIFPSESLCHYVGNICCYALHYYLLPSPAWKPSEDLIAPSGLCPWVWSLWCLNMKVSKVSFSAAKQAQQNSTPVTSIMCLQLTRHSTSSLLCCVQHPTSAVAAAQPGRLWAAARSSLRACSELTANFSAKKGWWLLWMSKTFSFTEKNLKLDQE